jgi:hypothetical protein
MSGKMKKARETGDSVIPEGFQLEWLSPVSRALTSFSNLFPRISLASSLHPRLYAPARLRGRKKRTAVKLFLEVVWGKGRLRRSLTTRLP